MTLMWGSQDNAVSPSTFSCWAIWLALNLFNNSNTRKKQAQPSTCGNQSHGYSSTYKTRNNNMWTPSWKNEKQNLAPSAFHVNSGRWNSRANSVGLLCFMVSKFPMQQGPWDTGLMHYVPSMKCQVCIYCSNYPLHIYRLSIDLEITHCNLSGISTGPNNTINFSQCFKAKFAAQILKGVLHSDKQLTPYVRTVNNVLLMEEMKKTKMCCFIVIKKNSAEDVSWQQEVCLAGLRP